ncbi:MAG: mechanosensitive ion channel family protein [Alloprevotella sp.]
METLKTLIENWICAAGASSSGAQAATLGIMASLAALLAFVADWLCLHVAVPIIVRVTRRTHTQWDDMLFSRRVLNSACHIVPAIVVWWLLPMVVGEYPLAKEAMSRVTAVYITVMTLRTLQSMIDAVGQMDTDRRSSAQQYFHTFCGVLRIVSFFVAAIVAVAIVLGRNPLNLIAGLGATSAVLMLVFKDTIEGLVAGIRLTSNEMMHIGDWITVPEAGADGTVVGMSLTTVKVRNFDNTIVTVSPKTLVDRSFRNWKGMLQADGRRVARRVLFDLHSIAAVTQQTAEKLQEKGYCTAEDLATPQVNMALYRRYMERFIAGRPEVNAGMQLMVRQLEPTPYGMPLEFYFFLHDKEWTVYEHQMAEIVEWAVVIAADFGLRVYEVASAEGPSGR